ncbi:MAG: diguanylate cyclase [Fervidobacterium sp.]|nr:diguanylate cyclase [Fervidobacterium sp.]
MNIAFHFLLVSGIFFVILGIYSLFISEKKRSLTFAFLCFSLATYVIAHAFELRAQNTEQVIFLLKLKFFGIPFVIPLLLALIYRMFFARELPNKVKIPVLMMAFLTVFFSSTNEYHNLMFTQVSLKNYGDFIVADLKFGLWYALFGLYVYILSMFMIASLFKLAKNARNPVVRKHSVMIILSILFPMISEIFYFVKLSPYNLDIMPFALSISFVFLSFAVFRYGFLYIDEILKDVLLSGIKEGIIILDKNNRLLEFNMAAKEMFEQLNLNLKGEEFSKIIPIEEFLSNNTEEIEMEVFGKKKYIEISKFEITDKREVIGKALITRDVTKRRELSNQLEYSASHDYLTGIFNRRTVFNFIQKQFELAKRYKRKFSIVIMDIDHFKRINDTYGHQTGDEVLKHIVKLVEKRLRSSDIIGRYGGEEYIIVLPETDASHGRLLAEDLRNMIYNSEFDYKGVKIKITASFGISEFDFNEVNLAVDELVKRADIALYQSKNLGRNRVSVYSEAS